MLGLAQWSTAQYLQVAPKQVQALGTSDPSIVQFAFFYLLGEPPPRLAILLGRILDPDKQGLVHPWVRNGHGSPPFSPVGSVTCDRLNPSRSHRGVYPPFFLGWCQASEQQPNADQVHEHFLGAGEPLVLCTQAALPRGSTTSYAPRTTVSESPASPTR